MQRRALPVVVGALVATTILGWFGRFGAWLEMLTNIPVQLLVVSTVTLVWSAVARNRWAAVLSGACVLWFAVLLSPYVFASPDERPGDPDRVHTALQYNVYFGNDDIEAIVAEIDASNADVVALHEITSAQWSELAARLTQYPYHLAEPWDGDDPQLGGGMALLARSRLDPIAVDPEASIEGRPVLAATTDIDGTSVVVVGLHPHASRFQGHKVELRNQQLDAVAALLRDETRPALILTDLNMAPTSSRYRALLEDLGWRDPHRLTGWDASWPTWGGIFGIPIDHVFVSDEIALHSIRSNGGGGSDHRSLIAEFSFG